MIEKLPIDQDIIDCGIIAKTCGYPHGYGVAEQELEKAGWRYSINLDAWLSPVGRVRRGMWLKRGPIT